MKRYIKLLLLILLVSFSYCKKYLDEKPDKKLVVPTTIQDAQAMLDNSSVFNMRGPLSIQIAADEHYLLTEDWNTASLTDKNSYIWDDDIFNDGESNDWSFQYVTIYYCNIILDALSENNIIGNPEELDNIKGQCLFNRSFAFYNLLQTFAKPFSIKSDQDEIGIPLRLTSDPNVPSVRANLKDCYERVINDLILSFELLPGQVNVLTRASKLAANALLARVFLSIEDYQNAFVQANNVINRYDVLLNYNDLVLTSNNPFERFNREVIFHSVTASRSIMLAPSCKIDSTLYQAYESNDLRVKLFFQNNLDGTTSYKGSYNGSNSLFNGLATDEIFLIRAECLARKGELDSAIMDLNHLLETRYETGGFIPFNSSIASETLDRILLERRKQLIFRSTRWSDLRRLNNDPQRSITIKRNIDGKEYTLIPNDNRYVFPIPLTVVLMSGIEQNPR